MEVGRSRAEEMTDVVGVRDLQDQETESVLYKICLAETESFLPPPCLIAQQQQND